MERASTPAGMPDEIGGALLSATAHTAAAATRGEERPGPAIDAAVGASAARVVAVMPWFAYSRQDKRSAVREPISARLVAHVLETAGADRMITVDLHAGQVQGFFKKPLDHTTALLMLARYFQGLGIDDLVVVSPDVGRVKLNSKFAKRVGADLALTAALPVARLTCWTASVRPDRVCPPKTQIRVPAPATAGYLTGTGSVATPRKCLPSVVASTRAS